MRRAFALAVFNGAMGAAVALALQGACGASINAPDAGGAVDDAGDAGADAGCEPCSALHMCSNGVCHPAGTPPGYCQACYDAGP